jgi:hypothetical protein
MFPVGFEPTIPASALPQTHAHPSYMTATMLLNFKENMFFFIVLIHKLFMRRAHVLSSEYVDHHLKILGRYSSEQFLVFLLVQKILC